MAGGRAVDLVVKQKQLGKFNFIQRDIFYDGYNMLHH